MQLDRLVYILSDIGSNWLARTEEKFLKDVFVAFVLTDLHTLPFVKSVQPHRCCKPSDEHLCEQLYPSSFSSMEHVPCGGGKS